MVITIISNIGLLFIMTVRIQTYIVAVSIAVLFGVCTLIMTNSGGPIAFVSSSLSAAASSVGDQGAAKMHLDEAMKALQAGDTEGAKLHLGEADKVLSEGGAKLHLGEAMKALQAGDIEGAKTHTQVAIDNL